jgi:hypothetical protein
MSTRLYSLPEVHHSSWIEMRHDIAMRYEVDHASRSATLFFGHRDDYVITMNDDNLAQLLTLGAAARQDLSTPPDAE